MYPIRSRARADLPKLPQTVVALVPKVWSVHRGAVGAKPFCVRNTAGTGRQETLTVTPRKFSLCSTTSRPAVQTVVLAVMIRSAGPVTQNLVAGELEVYFSLPGRSRKSRPVRNAHHINDPTSTANRLVSRKSTSACRRGRASWHGVCSVVPKRAGEHPHRACRSVDPNIGA